MKETAEIKKISKNETSQMENGHIVNNGNKVRRKEISNREIKKKLDFLVEEVLEMKKRQKRIEKAVKPEGGAQPEKKIRLFEETDSGNLKYTDLGRDIIREIKMNDFLTTNGLKSILMENSIERSSQSCRDWLTRIVKRFNESDLDNETELEYRKGKQGGKGGGSQSKIVVKR